MKRMLVVAAMGLGLRAQSPELPKPDAKQATRCAAVRPGEPIQAAIDACAKSGRPVYVELMAGEFTSGPLFLKSNVLIKLNQGATLKASLKAADYNRPNDDTACGSLSASKRHCLALINGKDVQHSGVFGSGVIEGQGYAQLAGVSDPADGQTWWDRARTAKTKYKSSKSLAAPRLIEIRGGEDLTFMGITLRNAPDFHLVLARCNRVLMDHLVINTPDGPHTNKIDPGHTAVDSGGIDIGASSNVTITNSFIRAGDDNIAIKSGEKGVATTNINISHCYFYAGHGLSIGSETAGNVSRVRVSDVVFNGTDNGLRIKSDRSKGGLVSDVSYQQVCMRNVKRPIVIDAHYDRTAKGESIPRFEQILLKDVTADQGDVILTGDSPGAPAKITLDNVVILKPRVKASNVEASELSPPGEGQLPIPPGEGVKTFPGVSDSKEAKVCSDSIFIAFPAP